MALRPAKPSMTWLLEKDFLDERISHIETTLQMNLGMNPPVSKILGQEEGHAGDTQLIIGHGPFDKNYLLGLAAALQKSWRGGQRPEVLVLQCCCTANADLQKVANAFKITLIAPVTPSGTGSTTFKFNKDAPVREMEVWNTTEFKAQWRLFSPSGPEAGVPIGNCTCSELFEQ
eukprot:TRINITY_DN5034_c0_g1_i2.p1 TRINITY_DN5034_c0_g1~~TRINITY_DN5034_c0_g1_i2.p1  ORF type:complete len:174 (+),score=46.29 TRINITY_DN5034_c0_g1_i2:66-587(+)